MDTLNNFLITITTPRRIVISRGRLLAVALALISCLSAPLWASPFFLKTGSPNSKLPARSHRPTPGKVETETADDFVLQETTVIRSATIAELLPAGTSLDNIRDVEVEVYLYHLNITRH